MKPDHIALGQLWQQTAASGNVRLYVVITEPRVYNETAGYPQAQLLDLERGSVRRVNSEIMTARRQTSWNVFEP